jgi:outer membrane protein
MIKKTKNILFSTIVATLLTTTVSNADFIGAEVGFATWSPALTGNIRKDAGTLDFEKDLDYGSEGMNSFVWAYVDHPIPLLPNIKVQKTSYSDTSTGTASADINFAGANITLSEKVTGTFAIDQFDIIPYWRILDNWINLDLGFNLKSIDANIKLDTLTTNQHANENFSVIIPMLYAKAKFDLPFTGFSAEADVSYINLVGNNLTDIKGGIAYETTFGFGAIAGIRKETLILEDIDSIYGNINIEGIYAGVFFHF